MSRGGFRAGAGRPKGSKKEDKPVANIDYSILMTSDPKQFLTALMNDVEADIKIRADAAKALLSASIRTVEAKGKKEQQQDAAKKVASRFAPSAPPKLVAAGGKKV